MSRRIEENDIFVLKVYFICADVLCNTAGFSFGNLCFPYSIQQGSFPVVNMSHDGYNRRPKNECADIFGVLHQ